jgi:penicillin-binding protein 1C
MDKKLNKILIAICGFVISGCFLLILIPLTTFQADYSKVLVDRNDELLSASIASDGQWRFPPINNIPEKYELALLTYEDKRFYYHFGLDPLAIGRAFISNFEAGEVISGASTITMQVIRLSRYGNSRTVVEKLLEALLAVHLELRLSKKEILSLYASHAPYGGNVVGLEAASWRYFGTYPDRLTWAESAMLAVLPNSPALIHPGRNRQKLLEKRNALLFKMYHNGIIDSLSCELSVAEKLPPDPHPMPMHASHLLERSKKESHSNNISRFASTVDKHLQIKVNEIIDRHYHINRGNQIHNAAALIIDIHDGSTLAYVGNLNNFNEEDNGNYVDIITAPRSTGSILKPFLYAGMLESGDILPGQLIPDIPTRLGGFAPQNYSRKYQGAVPAWQALARSLNVPAVRMLQSYGVDRFYHLLKNLGMSTLFRRADDYGLSLILGGAEGTLWDLTSIYASMAYYLQSGSAGAGSDDFQIGYLVDKKDKNSSLIVNYPLDAGTIWLVFEAMVEVVRPGSENPWRNYTSSCKIAWKTGTSYGHRDAWAIGVTADYAVGVWVGNADGEGRPGLTGLQAAAPILFDVFNILERSTWFFTPEIDLEEVMVCSRSGFRKGPYCNHFKLIQNTRSNNTRVCPYCKVIHLDKEKQYQVSSNCEGIENIISTNWFVLPPALEWFYVQNHSDYKPLPPFRSGCFDHGNIPLALIYPQKDSQIFVPIEIDGKLGRTIFRATHRDPGMKLFWHLDSEFLGETEDMHQISVAPQPGQHLLTVVDEKGNYLERKFTIAERH